MLKYTNFYITENDVKLMSKALESLKTQKPLTEYDRQCFFRLTKDMNNAIMELGGNDESKKSVKTH
jgi:hypothetical protein